MQNRLVPHPCMWIKIREEYLGNKESQPHTRAPQARVPVPGSKFPITCGCKNEQGLGQWKKFWSPKQFLLKNPHIALISLTSSELQHWGSSLKGTSGTQGETDVSGIKVRARG